MIAKTLPPTVVAAGDIRARTETWVVTTDVIIKAIYPKLPNGKSIKVVHMTHLLTCHHLPTGRKVVFTKKKRNWYDSRKQALRLRRPNWFTEALPADSDWRGATVRRQEVITEVARMGGGNRARAIVLSCC